MLFALGAAATALDAVSSLTSSGTSPSKPSSPPSTGFSAVDPFEIASPVSASSSAPVSGSSAGSQISPATLNTLIAAQGQSSTGSTSASSAWQDLSAQINGDAGSSDSSATASSYNSLAQMFRQQVNAMSFSAPPLSFSV
jgi:hypothetical protein